MIEHVFAYIALAFSAVVSLIMILSVGSAILDPDSTNRDLFLKCAITAISTLFAGWYIAHTMGL